MGVDYRAAAGAAAGTADAQAGLLECVVPANNVVREFLLEVRRQRTAQAVDGATDNMAAQMKRAADHLVYHPFRVHDAASAQRVKGCGPAIAKIIVEHLFAERPPEPPSEEELQDLARQEAAIKAQEAAQRKRKKQEKAAATALAAGMAPAPAFNAVATAPYPPAAAAAAAAAAGLEDDEEEAGAQGGRKKAKKAAKAPKAPKEYIPMLGSAPYCFLIVMLQAQKGPAKQQHFGKTELLELAEASGLSNKSIHGDASSKRQLPNGQKFDFDGWSGFRKQIIVKGLAHEWSNPKKVSLTPQGFALAERLYRDGVARGMLQPIPGIPTQGPLLFQLEEADTAAAAAAAAGMPAGVLASAALRPGRELAPSAARAEAAMRRAGAPAQAPLPRAAAAAAAPRLAAPLVGAAPAYAFEYEEEDELGLSLTQRLQRQQQQQQQQQQQACPVARAPVPLPPAAPAAAEIDVIDLLSDDSPSPVRIKRRRSAAAAGAEAAAAAHAAAAAVPPAAAVRDEQVAMMMGMGYSDKKSRRALRRSLGELGRPDIGRAIELAELLDSGAEESDAEEEGSGGLPVGLQPQRGWEQPPAAALPAPLLARADPAAFAGAWPPAVAATAAAALQCQDSGQQQQQQQGPAAGGHIRAGQGSQQQLAEKELEAEAPAEFSVDRFFSQLDRRLAGGGDDASADGPLAHSGSGSGGAASTASGTIRLERSGMRLPPLPPGRRFGEEYDVLALVDGREMFSRGSGQGRSSALDQHLSAMRAAGLVVEQRQLPIGDVAWVARSRRDPRQEYVLDYILERKSCDDLLSSIKSDKKGGSRYERQKYYLKRCGLRTIYYLLEGDIDLLPNVTDQKIARSAVTRTEVIDGFCVLRTTDHHSTFRLYQSLTQRIQALYRDLSGSPAAGQLPAFAAWQAEVKETGEGTVTLHDLWGLMLTAVPKVGTDAVQAILQLYPTPLHLHRAYQAAAAGAVRVGQDGHRAAEKLLHGLKTDGAIKSIGTEQASNVYNSLFRQRLGGGRPVLA